MQDRKIRVAVAGCGIVGSGVVSMLTENTADIERRTGARLALTHVLDVRPVAVPEGVALSDSLEDVLQSGIDVLVETIGGARIALAYTRRALERGVSVVSSNKELVATHGDELLALAAEHGAAYLYEASVGGGVPILRPIRDCLAGNRLTRVVGIVNGSTNYLLTRMEQTGLSFSAALGEAKTLGYVEANPEADVDGIDARRKLLILAHEAFGAQLAGDDRIPTVGISRMTAADLSLADAQGGRVKLIAQAERAADGWTGFVHPMLVPQGHPLYAVSDVFNGICVTGDYVGDVMFYGRGAGARPTASAVVGDVLEIARGLTPRSAQATGASLPMSSSEARRFDVVLRLTSETKDKALTLFPEATLLTDCAIPAICARQVSWTDVCRAETALSCIVLPILT